MLADECSGMICGWNGSVRCAQSCVADGMGQKREKERERERENETEREREREMSSAPFGPRQRGSLVRLVRSMVVL